MKSSLPLYSVTLGIKHWCSIVRTRIWFYVRFRVDLGLKGLVAFVDESSFSSTDGVHNLGTGQLGVIRVGGSPLERKREREINSWERELSS